MARLLSLKRVAERMDVSVRTVQRWVDAGEFPAATHPLPGQTQRWAEAVVEGWMALRSAGQSGFSAPPVKGKSPTTTDDNPRQDATNGDPQPAKPKTRV